MLKTETFAQCPVCDGGPLRRLLVAGDHESQTGDYGIDECPGCGIALTNPRPIESELPKLYEGRSTTDFPRTGAFVQRLRDLSIDRYLSSQLGEHPARAAEFRVLDYGCGDGSLARGLLRLDRLRGCKTHVTAVDFHAEPPPGLTATSAALDYLAQDDWSRRDERYDAIFIRHVLEHHSFPPVLLADFRRKLQPGGRLFIEVPNRRSVWARVFGRFYSGYYVPRHLFHFDAESLHKLLQRAGFAKIEVRQAHTPLIGRSIGYATGCGIGNTGLLGLASYPVQVVLDMAARRSTTLRAFASVES